MESFSGSASHIWLGHTLVAITTKICDCQQKIGYNLACAGDTPRLAVDMDIHG